MSDIRKGLSYPPTLPKDVLELIDTARAVTGDASIAYLIDLEMTVEEFRKYLLQRIKADGSKEPADEQRQS